MAVFTEVGVAVVDLQTAETGMKKRRKKETNITTPDLEVNLAVEALAAVAVNTADTDRGMSDAVAPGTRTNRRSVETPKREKTTKNTSKTMKW